MPTQALRNGLEIYKISDKRWLLNVSVPIKELINAIQTSSLSPSEKKEYLDALQSGLLQIPTQADMEESKKVEARFILELTSWLDTQLEKLRKKEEKTKENLATAAPSKGGVTSAKLLEEQHIDEIAQGLAEEIEHSLSAQQRQEEKIYAERRREKEYEFKEALKQLDTLAKLVMQYYIKEELKLLLKRGDYTEQELKRAINSWLQTKTENTTKETERNN